MAQSSPSKRSRHRSEFGSPQTPGVCTVEPQRKRTVHVYGGCRLRSWPRARLHMHREDYPALIREKLLRTEVRTESLGLNSDGTRAVLCGDLTFLLPLIFAYTVESFRGYMMCCITTDWCGIRYETLLSFIYWEHYSVKILNHAILSLKFLLNTDFPLRMLFRLGHPGSSVS